MQLHASGCVPPPRRSPRPRAAVAALAAAVAAALVIPLAAATRARAQAPVRPAPPELPRGAREMGAYWPGTWYAIRDGARDTVATFIVVRGPSRASFEETWQLGPGGGGARALRGWDVASGRGHFFWVSPDGHAQVWEIVSVGDRHYIQRRVEQDGTRFLSRQSWMPDGPDRVVWLMERSVDDGATWSVRNRLVLERGPEAPPRGARPRDGASDR